MSRDAMSGDAAAAAGDESRWRDPLWGRATRLEPSERALLRRPELRRLAGLHHHGPGGRLRGWRASRLTHTLGVWTIVAALRPDDATLRLAALVHDVGHAPYSHALESLDGLDHHDELRRSLERGALGAWLTGHGIDVAELLPLVDGRMPSPLRNRDGWLHADHLDSFVRGAAARGRPPIDATALLSDLVLDGPHLALAPRHADAVLEAVCAEAEWHVDARDVGADAWLVELVTRLLEAGALDRATLLRATDRDLDALLASHPATRAGFAEVIEGRRCFVAASDAGACWLVRKRAAYLPRLRIDGPSPAGWSQRLETAYAPYARARTIAVALAAPGPS